MESKERQRVKRTQRDYSLGFKLSVVAAVEGGEMTYKQAQRHYGIQGRSTVLVWLRKHGNLDWSPRHRPTEYRHLMPVKETPAQKIRRLERQVKDLQDKNLCLDTVVTIIDTEYGGSIRKKYLADALADFSKKEGSV